MDGLQQMMVLRDNAKHELEKIQSVEEGISYLNKLKAIDIWVKAEKKDAELQNIVAEQKLRTQRILGELISEGQRKGTIPSAGGDRKIKMPDRDFEDVVGVTLKQSSAFQQIASIPKEDFEEFIQEKKTAVKNAVAELTTTGAVKLAKSLREKESDLDTIGELDRELEINKEIKALAKDIKSRFNKAQRNLLIKLIS